MRLSSGIGILFPILLTGCDIVAIQPYEPASVGLRDSALSALSVRVVGERRDDVEFAAEILQKTRVFRSISVDEHSAGDLQFRVLFSAHWIPCGNPQDLTDATLGLVPTSNAYLSGLKFDVSAIGPEAEFHLESRVAARTRHGLWALALRASPRWSRPAWESDPANFASKLREDLLANESEILALIGR